MENKLQSIPEKQAEFLVGVKYCGGCQLRYDRAAALRNIRLGCGPGIAFAPVQGGGLCDFLLIMNGCQAQCVSPEAMRYHGPYCSMCHWTPTALAVQAILSAREEAHGSAGSEPDK